MLPWIVILLLGDGMGATSSLEPGAGGSDTVRAFRERSALAASKGDFGFSFAAEAAAAEAAAAFWLASRHATTALSTVWRVWMAACSAFAFSAEDEGDAEAEGMKASSWIVFIFDHSLVNIWLMPSSGSSASHPRTSHV